MNKPHLKFAALLLLSVFMAGCGDGKIAVTGSISYEGIVPEMGTVAFIGENGAGASYGEPYKNGHYSVRVPEGEYLVRITGWNTVTLDKPIESNMGRPPIMTRNEMIVPEEFGNLSKLQATVSRSERTIDFKLEKSSKPSK